ncbi:MAG: LamG domain-containing protein [Kofleriaceae bacterium]
MRWLGLVMLVGCRQIFGVGEPGPVERDAPAMRDAGLDGEQDGAPPITGDQCDPSSTGLVACWEFDGTLLDSSGHHLDIAPTQVPFVVGHVGQAVATDNADLNVADSHLLDVDAVTIEAWIYPAAFPMAGSRGAILDNNNQYAMYVEANGTLRCYTGLATADATNVLQLHIWNHVACTADGAKLHAYVNGVEVAGGVGAGIPTGSTTGLTIGSDNPSGTGSRFTGRLDAVRLYGRQLTQEEIRCAYNPNC